MFLDIPYSASAADPHRQLDLYLPPVAALDLPLIVFVHGGAWRAEDKRDYKTLALNLVAATGFPVAVPNYRLTPVDPPDDDHFHHPGHAEDTLQALTFLTTWQGPHGVGPLYDPTCLYLMGHSCSAHILSTIFLDSSSVTPTLTPSPSLLQAVKAIVMSEGIYDIDKLLYTFPTYRHWFIRPTFGPHSSYTAFSTTSFPLIDTHIRWLIIHSKGDTLVDLPQSEAIYDHLHNLHGSLAAIRVYRNTDQLTEGHNNILLGLEFVDIVKQFILRHHKDTL